MNIETKIVENNVDLYKSFGWELTDTKEEKVRWGHTHKNVKRYVLARDKEDKNYEELKKLESKYFELDSRRLSYTPIDSCIAIILFLLFIIPCIFYVWYKKKEQNRIDLYNQNLEKQKKQILNQANSLMK